MGDLVSHAQVAQVSRFEAGYEKGNTSHYSDLSHTGSIRMHTDMKQVLSTHYYLPLLYVGDIASPRPSGR